MLVAFRLALGLNHQLMTSFHSFLTVDDSCRQLSAVVGHCRQLLAVVGSCWQLLDIFTYGTFDKNSKASKGAGLTIFLIMTKTHSFSCIKANSQPSK